MAKFPCLSWFTYVAWIRSVHVDSGMKITYRFLGMAVAKTVRVAQMPSIILWKWNCQQWHKN